MRLLIPLCLAIFPCLAHGECCDRHSLENRLSMFVSEMCLTNGNMIALKTMNSPEGFYVENTGNSVSQSRYVGDGTSFLLKCGDVLRMACRASQWVSEIAVTNRVEVKLRDERRGGFDDPNGIFLSVRVFKRLYWHGKSLDNYRSFLVDFGSGNFYDVERCAFGKVQLPFHSIWRNWEECPDWHGDAKVDDDARLRGFANVDRDNLARNESPMCRAFWDFCCGHTNESSFVVLYRKEERKGDKVSYLALVKVGGVKPEVLGTAQFHTPGSSMSDTIDVFGDDGGLLWSCYFNVGGGRRCFSFDGRGNVRDFVELDGEGGELPLQQRILKDRTMVVPEKRPSFFAAMEKVIHPLLESWKKRNYVNFHDSVSPLGKSLVDGSVGWSKTVSRKIHEQVIERNRERCAIGLPDMTETEKIIFLRKVSWERDRRWCEQMRHETTGRKVTTEVDAMIDLERVRLNSVYWAVARGFPSVVDAPVKSPKTLRDLIGLRDGKFGQLILPGGEDDIKDQWGHEYRYRVGQGEKIKMASEHPVITSAGPDGVFGTEDDLSSEDWFVFRRIENERRREQPGMSSNR